ncbi:MAG: plastocyanin/azurin family copper-binding protein [Vicinamibacterales bacterium]
MLALLFAAVMAWPGGLSAVALAEVEALPEAAQDAPRVLLDQSPRVVEYQLGRLSNDQLVRVERRDTDDKFRPVYAAILSRKGMARPARVEALSALVKIGNTSATRVLLDALGRMSDEDMQNAGTLLDILFEQPADVLRPQRESLAQAATDASQPAVLRGIYGALMIADGDPAPAWQVAAKHEGHLLELLRSVPHLGKSDALRAALFTPVAALFAGTGDPAGRMAAVEALAFTRRDGATFDLLAREILEGSDEGTRAAAIRSLQLLPEAVWTPSMIEPLARRLVAMVRNTASDRRTEPPAIDALQLGDRLAVLLPAASRLEVRRDLRALGVQVVRIQAVPEQMLFDVKWFAVQAAKPVQIVLANPDAMPHNLVIGQPGSLQEIGTKGGAMPPPADPTDSSAKAYVPDSPLVLHATRLLNGGDTERLTFTAPAKPGEYVFLCTFPGHFVRMYGVMLVVENLEAWEAKPTVPTDPVTNRPFPPK